MTGTLTRPAAGAPARSRSRPDLVLVLVTVVAALAVGTLGFRLGAGADPLTAGSAALAVAVAGCPYPVALTARTLRRAAVRRVGRAGMPVSAGQLVALAEVDTVLLPRTGVLTAGAPRVHAVHVVEGMPESELLRLAAAAERPAATTPTAEHPAGDPLAAAVLAAAAQADIEVPDVAEDDRMPGLGVRGLVADLVDGRVLAHAVLVGGTDWLAEHDIALPAGLAAVRDAAEAAGRSAVAVTWDGVPRGLLELADPERPDAAAALTGLRRAGVAPLLATGASPVVAGELARRIGLPADAVHPGLRGAGPAALVAELVAGGATPAAPPPGVEGALELPPGPTDVASVTMLLGTARRLGRSVPVVRGLTAGAALIGAGTAAVGLTGPVVALLVPVVGLTAVAVGRAVVAGLGTTRNRGRPAGHS